MPAPGDLIHQQSTSTGTGNITLSAVNGKRSFNDEFGTGGTNKFDYFISNQAAAEWERGTGHLSASTTLVRDTVLASSNANAAVSFSAGTKDIANDVPAALQVRGPGSATVGNIPLWDSSSGNLLKDAGYAPREVLTANRTYYVRTDGSNSNNGLANTSGGAFLTIQKAIDTACALDLSVYAVTINVADGSYGAFVLKNYVGVGPISIIGNVTTPANVNLSGSSTNISGTAWNCRYVINGMKVANSAGNAIAWNGPGSVNINNLEFGACSAAHIRLDNSCFVNGVSGSFKISGAAAYSWLVGFGSQLNLDSSTITYSASVAYSQSNCYAQHFGFINLAAVTFTLGGNTITGKRYTCYGVCSINTNNAGASFVPGDVAGTSTGFQGYN